jgi:hypothetical protein
MVDHIEATSSFQVVEGGAAIDKPIRGVLPVGGGIPNEGIDTLNTFGYAKALAEHVKGCGTPLTVGVQGEWGSGKTSLLNMMKEQIEETKGSSGRRGKGEISGRLLYKTIWINTWEHSLLKSPEQCLLSVISELIDAISEVDGSYTSAQRAKSALTNLARGAVRIGAAATLGAKGGDVADEILGDQNEGENSVKLLRRTLENTISKIIDRETDENYTKRFIIFIDDLDRLEPSTAVMVLELLKNIFDLPHCVFVVAIDYQVVVKGLKGKFGEPTEENEWEFRAFFDKIIQLPFMMPMATYSLDKYIENLLEGVHYFKTSEVKGLVYFDRLIRMTVGYNPRALKRLVNSLSLILKYYRSLEEEKIAQNETANQRGSSQDYNLKQLVLVFVCVQISFPKIFELLLQSPTFYDWDDEFVNRITGGPHTENKELAESLNRAMEVNSEDFDSDWEQALFKIVWIKEWQRNKLVQASRVLSIIEDEILRRPPQVPEALDLEHTRDLREALKLTAVTSVASTDDTIIFSPADSDTSQDTGAAGRMAYWQSFRAHMQNVKSRNEWVSVRSTHSSAQLIRKHPDLMEDRIQLTTSTKSSAAIRIESYAGDLQSNYELFVWLRSVSDRIFEAIGANPNFKVADGSTKQSILFSAPKDVAPAKKDLSAKEYEADRDKYISWISEKLPLVEDILAEALQEYENPSRSNAGDQTPIESEERTEGDVSISIEEGKAGIVG